MLLTPRRLSIVALDLPTSDYGLCDTKGYEFTDRMLGAINLMLVGMMEAIARNDYEQRRERQAQGIEKAKAAGKYQGRPMDVDLHKRVTELLVVGLGIRHTASFSPELLSRRWSRALRSQSIDITTAIADGISPLLKG